MLIKIQPDGTVRRYLFAAKSLYMFRVSQYPSSGVVKTVTATSGTGHNTGTATSLRKKMYFVLTYICPFSTIFYLLGSALWFCVCVFFGAHEPRFKNL